MDVFGARAARDSGHVCMWREITANMPGGRRNRTRVPFYLRWLNKDAGVPASPERIRKRASFRGDRALARSRRIICILCETLNYLWIRYSIELRLGEGGGGGKGAIDCKQRARGIELRILIVIREGWVNIVMM